MEFGYLILRKISKFVATRCQIMKAKKRAKCNFGWSFHNMVNFGLLTAEIHPGVWGTPTNFNGFRVLAALLHGI